MSGEEAEARRVGVAATIRITDKNRHPNCGASVAHFTGVEDNHAVYKGECMFGHTYQEEIKLTEKQVEKVLELEQVITIGGEGYKAKNLEEF